MVLSLVGDLGQKEIPPINELDNSSKSHKINGISVPEQVLLGHPPTFPPLGSSAAQDCQHCGKDDFFGFDVLSSLGAGDKSII